MRVRRMTTAAELVMCAVILHNLCVRFSDNSEDLQDGADVNIVDDNFAIEPGRLQDDRWQQLLMLMHFLCVEIHNLNLQQIKRHVLIALTLQSNQYLYLFIS